MSQPVAPSTPLHIDPDRTALNIAKNTATSYGLTLVAAFPPPSAMCASIQRVQGQIEQLLPQRFTWYAADWLHVTLLALLRGRYREQPPLQRDELPCDLEGFVQVLSRSFAQLQPFSLNLSGLHLTQGGLVLVNAFAAVQVRELLVEGLSSYPELDLFVHPERLHLTIGYLNIPTPFVDAAEEARFAQDLSRVEDVDFGVVLVDQVWLVHYANRRLSHVAGKVSFHLGVSNALTPERLTKELAITIA